MCLHDACCHEQTALCMIARCLKRISWSAWMCFYVPESGHTVCTGPHQANSLFRFRDFIPMSCCKDVDLQLFKEACCVFQASQIANCMDNWDGFRHVGCMGGTDLALY